MLPLINKGSKNVTGTIENIYNHNDEGADEIDGKISYSDHLTISNLSATNGRETKSGSSIDADNHLTDKYNEVDVSYSVEEIMNLSELDIMHNKGSITSSINKNDIKSTAHDFLKSIVMSVFICFILALIWKARL